jgi:hypothetical protein
MFQELMHSWVGYKLVKFYSHLDSVQKIGKTWNVGQWIYSIFFPTLATNNGTLQKKNVLKNS